MIPANLTTQQPSTLSKPQNNQTTMGKLLVGQMLKKRQKQFTPYQKPTLTPTQVIPTKPAEFRRSPAINPNRVQKKLAIA